MQHDTYKRIGVSLGNDTENSWNFIRTGLTFLGFDILLTVYH
jgi:hypothetical protein